MPRARINSRFSSCILAAATLVVASAGVASAQGYGYGYGYGARPMDGVDARQANQARRIEQGYRDGSLTPREAAGLAVQQRQIADYERRARADGHLDAYERQNLHAMQNHASRTIARERHDFEGRNAGFDRPWWRRWW